MKSLFVFIKFIALILAVQSKLLAKPMEYCSDNEVWKHAAYAVENGKLSQKKVHDLIEAEYCGLEFDIIYDEDLDIVYVAHDPIASAEERKIRELRNLDPILSGYKGYVWLDWKNTKVGSLRRGLTLIEDSLQRYLTDENVIVFIETPEIYHNELMQTMISERFLIVNWLSISGRGGWIVDSIRMARAYAYKCMLPNRWISTPHIKIGELCTDSKPQKLFLFTINEIDEVKRAFSLGFSVVLTDTILPSELSKER